MVEVTRSFSYKMNMGNYETRDFFCSQKKECPEPEAEATAKQLMDFCKKMVLRDIQEASAEKK